MHRVETLKPPAECTILGACIKRWGHLYALVRFYAIESVLVATWPTKELILRPMADLNCRMPPDKTVMFLAIDISVYILHEKRIRNWYLTSS